MQRECACLFWHTALHIVNHACLKKAQYVVWFLLLYHQQFSSIKFTVECSLLDVLLMSRKEDSIATCYNSDFEQTIIQLTLVSLSSYKERCSSIKRAWIKTSQRKIHHHERSQVKHHCTPKQKVAQCKATLSCIHLVGSKLVLGIFSMYTGRLNATSRFSHRYKIVCS